MTAGEEWRPVVGYEGWYEVSSHGRVKRVRRGKGCKRPILSPAIGKVGYRVVVLSTGSIATRKRLYVHRLVAAAFLGPCPHGLVVNHIDNDKLNNHPCNLEYVTQSQNAKHAWRLGVCPFGERNGHAKLTEQDVQSIRALRGVYTTRALGEMFGVNHGAISVIQTGKSWRHLLPSAGQPEGVRRPGRGVDTSSPE